jgi:type IV secretory pathway VirB10-like protein
MNRRGDRTGGAVVRLTRRALATRRSSDRVRRRLGGLAYFAAAAAVIVAFEGLAAHRRSRSEAPSAASTATALPRERVAAASALTALPASPAPAAEPTSPVAPPAQGLVRATRGEATGEHAAAHAVDRRGKPHRGAPSREEVEKERRSAEDARFRAAWARIEAERREASHLASEAFGAGKSAEADAESRLRSGDFLAATRGFERAAELFRGAEDASRQARLARIRLSAPSL